MIKSWLRRFVAWLQVESQPVEVRVVEIPEIRIVVTIEGLEVPETLPETVAKAIPAAFSGPGLRPIEEHFAKHTKVLVNSDLVTKRR